MDDDDFGGFEAAESYECGNGEKQTTSPAIAWAAFPTVSEVHVSPDVLLEHSVPSSCLVPSDSFSLSSGNVATAIQTANNGINPAVLEEQIQSDILVASLNVTEDKTLVTSNIALVDAETQKANEPKSYLQQAVANLEIKLSTAEEEKLNIKKELECLLEKHSVLEMDFLKEKKKEVISHKDDYKKLQEKHKQELEDMRKAGHEALSIIVEEFKALLQSTVQQQEAAIEKQYIQAIEKHSHKCEELLNAQHQRLLDILEAEKELLSEKIEEALMQQSQKQKEVLEKCLDEERQRSKEAVAAAAKAEKEVVQEAVLKAVEEERRKMEEIHAEERKMWEAECDRHKEKIAEAVSEAMQEQRKRNQEIVKEALMEEQKRSEKAIEEAVKRTREELLEYIKEQKRLDEVVRQRNLCSLELFLSCAQKQLSVLLKEEPTTTEENRD
ncbi:coiled-coil domain-containing protein 91 isoform X1 [Apus apus]|uniref:coiled-coil domain-containing protein 91 isoform X1 n=1 Tax=Apus apus TaxID=8895 RepID=UPI0021F90EFA|nr:coiled-coil domain-containing protein 91 isoform X1 [Apus apus]XP_051484695.1 coiled-coil domain-containing protein 91 isoform X1 [Apus apus]XP_051484704.1 coiled-coil domain-containing protein 91 isoform X1 [Apus apus]XP_051484713.1 coiled-coil domain-containing protein 91 isoform X1 [Apus apus]XP_051484723.1 coiled-coil domain-containing protein 91 isoform X1 [Apus apus]XP_051484732.1 coiled-coil domain-containing protein 91 isoform X1 [Apus apus]XP_051484742.1 coiled-coil domain-contain